MAKQRKCTAQSVSALLRKAGFRRSEPDARTCSEKNGDYMRLDSAQCERLGMTAVLGDAEP
jgi:hypothetical protein